MSSTFDVRRSVAKYKDLHERLWARSRDAVARRNRIDASEKRLFEASTSEEERQYNGKLFALRKRALDFSIKELAIEISHVADVIESLQQVQVAQDTGANDVSEAAVAHLAFERYEEWAGTSHELYSLRSQALEVASDIMRLRPQRPKLQEKPQETEDDLSAALCRMRTRTQSLMMPVDEPDGGGDGLLALSRGPEASATGVWWERLLKSTSERTSQQTYLRQLFNLNGPVHTFEARKILEFVEECEKFAGEAMGRRVVQGPGSGNTRSPAVTRTRRQSRGKANILPPLGIQPDRFHEFLAALSYYVVEQQRKLHNEEWNEEEVQLLLEEHIMSSVRSLAMTYVERPAEDLQLKEMCEALAAATQEQVGISEEFASTELVPFCEAIALLRSMFFSLTPSKKLFCVASAANSVFQQLQSSGVDVQRVGADAFMDIWVYVIIKANVTDLVSSISFMSEYAVRSLSTGQAGYFLASLQVATTAIMRMNVAEILKPMDSGGHIVVCQRAKYLQLSKLPSSAFEVVTPCQTLVGYRMCAIREWLMDTAKFYSVVLESCPNDPNAVVSVAIIRINSNSVTPSQLQFLKSIFLPSNLPGLHVESTPLGSALCINEDPSPLSAIRLKCTDFGEVEQSLMQLIALERLGAGSDPIPAAAELPSTSTDNGGSTSTGAASVSDSARHAATLDFQPSLATNLEVKFRQDFGIAETLALPDAVSLIVRTTQTVCQHLEHLSSLAPVDGIFSDLLLAAVKSFKIAFKAEHANNPKYEAWSEEGILTAEVFGAMKTTLNSYLEDLAHLGFLVPYGANACDPSERTRAQIHQVISGCQRGWHLPIHVHGSLGKRTREEIRRRMAMLTAVAKSRRR